MTDEPKTIFRPIYRCSNCGALIDEDMLNCVSCSATFGTYTGIDENRRVRHTEYTQEAVNRMILYVPNGEPTTGGVGGIGECVSNHYIQMGSEPTGSTLTWKGIALGISLLSIEGYSPSVMLIHPFQMIDLLTSDIFVGMSERGYLMSDTRLRAPNREGVIGIIGGMHVIVSKHMSAGYALMFDDAVFINNGDVNCDAAVLLYGGRNSLFSG